MVMDKPHPRQLGIAVIGILFFVSTLHAAECDTDCNHCKRNSPFGEYMDQFCKQTCDAEIKACKNNIPIKVPDVGQAAQDAGGKAVQSFGKLISDAAKIGDTGLTGALENLQVLTQSMTETTKTAVVQALSLQDKAARDAAINLVKSANDLVDAGKAGARYVQRIAENEADIMRNAERRFREGKVADAFFHMGTERIQKQNDNSFQTVQENELIATAAQAGAGFVGGPGGSAAYAAWYAFNKSGGKVDVALAAGVKSYLLSEGLASVADMPTGTPGEIAKKATANGVVNGVSVAAAGGNEEDIKRAMAEGAGSVIVQSGQEYVKQRYRQNAKLPKYDAYCMSATGLSCSDAKEWVDRAVEQAEQAKATVIGVSNGQWAISFDKEAMQVPKNYGPGVVATYIGAGSEFAGKIAKVEQLAAGGRPEDVVSNDGDEENWEIAPPIRQRVPEAAADASPLLLRCKVNVSILAGHCSGGRSRQRPPEVTEFEIEFSSGKVREYRMRANRRELLEEWKFTSADATNIVLQNRRWASGSWCGQQGPHQQDIEYYIEERIDRSTGDYALDQMDHTLVRKRGKCADVQYQRKF